MDQPKTSRTESTDSSSELKESSPMRPKKLPTTLTYLTLSLSSVVKILQTKRKATGPVLLDEVPFTSKSNIKSQAFPSDLAHYLLCFLLSAISYSHLFFLGFCYYSPFSPSLVLPVLIFFLSLFSPKVLLSLSYSLSFSFSFGKQCMHREAD